MTVRVKLNMGALVKISNIANAKIARPLADRIVASTGKPGDYRIEETERQSVPGWGRTRVFTDNPRAMSREARDGTLARALGAL